MNPDEINHLRRTKYNATVARLLKPNPELMLVRVKPDFPLPPHLPGQYTTLGLGIWEPRFPGCQEEEGHTLDEEARLGRRSYSISHPVLTDDGLLFPEQHEWLEFYIVLVRTTSKHKAPVLTPRLFMLREGDRLHMGEKITGHFTLEGVKPDDSIIFLSTGTGEAPHNYMLWELLRRNHPGRILSVCCVRYRQDLGYLATHETLARRHSNYVYHPMTTREGGSGGKKYIQDLFIAGEMETLLGKPLDPASTHVYLCGNPAMIGLPEKDKVTGELKFPEVPGMVELLTKRGFQLDQPAKKIRGNVHYEEYW